MAGRVSSWLAAVFLACLVTAPAGAQEEPPPVALDRLLKIPSSYDLEVSQEKRGGATAEEWRRRFRDARLDVEQARANLREVVEELEEGATEGAWKVAPPGLPTQQQNTDHTAPRNELGGNMGVRRARSDLERAEKALRDLEIEANLAGVPESWRTSDG